MYASKVSQIHGCNLCKRGNPQLLSLYANKGVLVFLSKLINFCSLGQALSLIINKPINDNLGLCK